MKIVIAGGTGFVGQSFVAKLTEEQHEVTVLARDPARAEQSFGGRARVIGWSLEPGPVRAAWEREVAAAAGVVNLAGAGVMDRAWTPARKQELLASRVSVTQAIAQAMAGGAGPQRARVLVSVSAV
jgi:NAD dependent epimerase/dehydratase family enzyme